MRLIKVMVVVGISFFAANRLASSQEMTRYIFRAVHSNMCMALVPVSPGDFTQWTPNTAQAGCHGELEQAWLINRTDLVNGSPTQMRSVASDKCLSALVSWGALTNETCDSNDDRQKWTITVRDSSDPNSPSFTILNASTNQCVDVWYASHVAGKYLFSWECHSGDNQSWKMFNRVWRPIDSNWNAVLWQR